VWNVTKQSELFTMKGETGAQSILVCFGPLYTVQERFFLTSRKRPLSSGFTLAAPLSGRGIATKNPPLVSVFFSRGPPTFCQSEIASQAKSFFDPRFCTFSLS